MDKGTVAGTEEEVEKLEVPDPEDIPDDYRCGYGRCKPDCTQRCNSPPWLLSCVCWFTFAQGFVCSGIVNVNMSTVERRFQLSTGEVAWISASYDIMAGILAPIVGYVALFAHNGRILSAAAYSMALGSFIMFLPYLTAGVYELGLATSDLCGVENGTVREHCDEYDTSLSNNLYLFILGQLFHGAGGTTLYTIAVPYMDSNVRIQNTPIYIGIMYAFAALGPAVGYVAGGTFLAIYVDFSRVDMDDVHITSIDPRWVGAWWIGYLFSVIFCLTAALLMCLWPKELPVAPVYRQERESMSYKGKGEQETKKDNFGKSWKDLGYSLKLIITNPVWIFITIAGIAVMGMVVAMATFLPKIMQYQFALTTTQAAIAAGIVIIPGAMGGFILGGVFAKRLDLKMRGLVCQTLATSIITIGLSFIFLIYCQQPHIAGVTVNYDWSELEDVNLNHMCHAGCNCSTTSYDPVCSRDGMEYFSPCHGGCVQYEVTGEDEDVKIYHDCSCINDTLTTPGEAEAKAGICEADCAAELVVFLILFFFIMFATFFGNTAGQTVMLRSIPDAERSFAVGLSSFFIRFLGTLPAPLIVGAIFDSACLVWQETCGETGACWIYDSEFVAWGVVWCVFAVALICTACYIVILIVYKPPPDDQDNEQTDKDSDLDYHADKHSENIFENFGVIEEDTTFTKF